MAACFIIRIIRIRMGQIDYVLCLYFLISKNVVLPIWTLGTFTTSFGVILMKTSFMHYYIFKHYFRDKHIFAAGKLCMSFTEGMICDVNYNMMQGMCQKNAKSVLWYLSGLSFLRG